MLKETMKTDKVLEVILNLIEAERECLATAQRQADIAFSSSEDHRAYMHAVELVNKAIQRLSGMYDVYDTVQNMAWNGEV